MILQLNASNNRLVTGITIYPASEEYNRLQLYPNAIIVDNSLITEDFDLYEVLDGKTPTLIEGWETIKANRLAEYEAEEARIEAEGAAISIRTERDAKLTQSDWTQAADAPVDQAAWVNYRQALRDIPNQEGFPTDVAWPAKPE